MTAVTVDVPTNTPGPTRSRALAARRWFLVASPVLAGVFAVIGAYADPAAGISGRELYELYGANPDPLQFKSLGFHWAYAFWMAPAVLAVPYVRGRGSWFANVAGIVGFAGLVTLPGLLFVDYYDSAIAQEFGVDGAVAVEAQMNQMWGVPAFALPGMIGLFLALPLIGVALWRAGLVRWWAPAATVAGFAAFTLSNITWWGCVITTGFFTVFAIALARATRPRVATRS
jgi:hypothetical protein